MSPGMTTEEPTSSAMTSVATSGMAGAEEQGLGGGSAVVAAMNPSSTPWQASIAVKDTMRVPVAGDAASSADCSSSETGSCAGRAASDWYSSQTSAAPAAHPAAGATAHDAAAQHEDGAAATSAASARRSSAASVAGSRPWACAHASSSAGELQQQLAKHCSAVLHPQGLSMQGNGCVRSFAASRWAAGEPAGGGLAIGSGSPDTTSPCARSTSHRTARDGGVACAIRNVRIGRPRVPVKPARASASRSRALPDARPRRGVHSSRRARPPVRSRSSRDSRVPRAP